MSSELTYRGHEEPQSKSDSYTPKPLKPWFAILRPIRYILREQRLLFIFLGIAIATLFFSIINRSPPPHHHHPQYDDVFDNSYSYFSNPASISTIPNRRVEYEHRISSSGGKIPLGLKRKGLRVLVTGGAGFVGSHLVDRLMNRGDSCWKVVKKRWFKVIKTT